MVKNAYYEGFITACMEAGIEKSAAEGLYKEAFRLNSLYGGGVFNRLWKGTQLMRGTARIETQLAAEILELRRLAASGQATQKQLEQLARFKRRAVIRSNKKLTGKGHEPLGTYKNMEPQMQQAQQDISPLMPMALTAGGGLAVGAGVGAATSRPKSWLEKLTD